MTGPGALTALTALAMAYAGFVTLALAMDRHRHQLLARELPRRFTLPLRLAGGALLAGALHVACRGTGSISVGVLWWLGLLSVAGLALGVLLAYQPRRARWIGVAALSLAAAGWLAQAPG